MEAAIQRGGVSQRERKGGGPARPPSPPPAPRSASDILAAARARAEARRVRARQSADASSVQLIIALLEMQDLLQFDYNELDRNRAHYPDAVRQMAEISRDLGQVKIDLDFYLNPKQEDGEDNVIFEGRKHQLLLSVEEARRLVALRDAARGWTEAIRAIENPDAKTITSFLEDSEANIGPFVTDVTKGSPSHVTTWKGRSLGSSMPNDDVISEVAKTFGEMVDKFTYRKEKEDDDVTQLLEHAGYYISEDEVDTVRRSDESVNMTRFLNGEGQYSVLGYRFGEALVFERRADGRVYPFKASGAKIGRRAFLYRDQRNNGALKPVDRNRLRAIDHEGTNVSKVFDDVIREAMEFQLRREAESAERREVSQEVRNMTGLQDPITAYDLAVTGKVGVCVMDYGLRNGDHLVRVPPYRLSSDGTSVWVSEHAPGALEKAPWLKRLLDQNKPLPISELRKLHEWKEASRANGHFEARWQTELKTAELGATMIRRENLDGLVSVDGVDGTYTFTTSVRRKGTGPKPYFVPGGFAVKREGSKVKLIWATSNVASEANRMGDKPVEIADLPFPWFFVMQSLSMDVMGLRREKDGWKKLPAHLQRKNKEENDTQEQAKE